MTKLTEDQMHEDVYAHGLHVVKDGGDPVTVAQHFGSTGLTALYSLPTLVTDLIGVTANVGGKKARKKLAGELKRAIHRGHAHRTARLLDTDGLERKGRLNDVVEKGLLHAEAAPIIRRTMREALGERGIRDEMFTHEQLRDEPALPDLIEGVLPQASLATLVGRSGLGKTAAGLSMAAAIAMNRPWMGRSTAGGPAVYCLAEGGRGASKRLDALAAGFYSGQAIEDLIIIRRPIDMTDTHGEVTELRAIVAEIDPAVIFFDTLIRYAGGAEENSSTGMSIVLGNMEWVARAGTRTTAVAVHHTGHEGTRARGTSAIYANVDAELTLSGEASALKLTATKMKDGRQGLIGEFRLKESPDHGAIVFEGIAPGQGQPSGHQAARVEEALSHFARAFGVTGVSRPALVKSLVEWMSVSEPTAQRYIGDLIKDGRLAAGLRGRSTWLELPTTVMSEIDPPAPVTKSKKSNKEQES